MKELYDTVMLAEVYILHSGCFVFNLVFHLFSAIFYHGFSLLGGFLTANTILPEKSQMEDRCTRDAQVEAPFAEDVLRTLQSPERYQAQFDENERGNMEARCLT